MLLTQQIRAARMLLEWTQETLAQSAGIGIATIKRLESKSGPMTGQAETIWRIQAALEKGGVVFISSSDREGPGVRLARPYEASNAQTGTQSP